MRLPSPTGAPSPGIRKHVFRPRGTAKLVFQRRTKKRTAPRPKTAHRGQGSIATTRATCDVRAAFCGLCIGRGGVVTAQRRRSTTAGWGRIFFRRSSARTAPFCVAITTATFPESRFFYAFFSRHAACSCGGRRLALCTWPTGQGA